MKYKERKVVYKDGKEVLWRHPGGNVEDILERENKQEQIRRLLRI